MQNAYPSVLQRLRAMVEKHKQKHEKSDFMKVIDITTLPTYLVDVEHENTNYEVRVGDASIDAWEYAVLNVDDNEEIPAGTPLYDQLLKAAEDAIDAQKKPVTIEDLRRIETLSDPNKMRTPDMLFRELQLINIIAKQLIKKH
jgi:hypothetical protein